MKKFKLLLACFMAFGLIFISCGNDTSDSEIIVKVIDIPSQFNNNLGNIILHKDDNLYDDSLASGSFGSIVSGTLELLMRKSNPNHQMGTQPFFDTGNFVVVLSIISEPGNIIWLGITNKSISQGINIVSFNDLIYIDLEDL